MSKRMTPDEFYSLAQALYQSNAGQEDINALIDQCLVSIDREYLNGIQVLWRRRLEIIQQEVVNRGRGIYS